VPGRAGVVGCVRPVQGVLPGALAARETGHTLIVPAANAEEACLASGLKVIAVNHLLELVSHLNGHTVIEPFKSNGLILQTRPYPDLDEVQGQTAAKSALLMAAGAHNLLFSGHPGTGKTLLASRLPGLLPPLEEREALEAAAIQLVASHSPLTSWPQRPFRQPHHSASSPALVGGGCDISQ
jgi:magnesium chelatase family protein